jgi:hypothetical protein
MPNNFDELNQAIADLVTEATATEGVEDSAVVVITGFAAQVDAAVTAALTADRAANATSIAAAKQAIADTLAGFVAHRTPLADAIAAIPGPVQP